MKKVNNIKVDINKEKIYRLLGKKKRRLSRRLSQRVERCIEETRDIINPRILYTTSDVNKIDKNSLQLSNNVTLKSARMSHSLKGCDSVTVFVATIGEKIDELIEEAMKENRLSDAYIYDAIGSVAVEEAVDNFQKTFDEKAKEKDETTTLRFSPGYCDWQIQEQKKLFDLLSNKELKVELSDSCLMTPRKSVSGVFGICDSKDVNKEDTNPCKRCGMRSCIARRA